MQPEYRPVLETSAGQLEKSQIHEFTLFPHQYLSHTPAQNHIGQLNLITYKHHLDKPFNTVNTSITPTLLLHQLQHSIKPLIVDASTCKDLSPFKGLTVVKGTKFQIRPISKEEGAYLYSKSTIKQTLQNNFALNDPKPSFIGQFLIEQLDINNQHVKNGIQAALQIGKEIGCFILLNMISKQNPQAIFENDQNKVLSQTYQKVFSILQINKKFKAKILLYNPLVLLKTSFVDNKIVKQLASATILEQIRKANVIIGYDVLRYSSNQDFIHFLIQQLNKYSDSTIISHGALFKTDLTSFGGLGFSKNPIIQLIQSKITSENYQKVTRLNILQMLFWKTKQIVVRQIQYWNCDSCKKQASEDVQRFRKLGKEFCSTACIRNYKF